jgi:hypothetical protein
MELIEGNSVCAVCENADSAGGKEMCVNISGKHFHVLVCVECHLQEIGRTFGALAHLLSHQQKEIDKNAKKPTLGIVQ